MPKHFPDAFGIILLLFLIILSLPGCAKQATDTPSPALTSEPTVTEEIATPHPADAQDVVILSLEEDGYAHLFAYIPERLPLTRLTDGTWSDIAPALSRDGRQIAFASNRNGYWDLYLLDIESGDIEQLTDTPDYDGSPSWSPDGAFLAYESYKDDNLDIVVSPSNDPASNAVPLTDSPAADYSPAWAPDGRHIAFISTRSGNSEVWLADLDRTDADRYQNLSNTPQAAECHPMWTYKGAKLAWASNSQSIGRSGIYVWDSTKPERLAQWVGDGDWPAWNPGADQILTTIPAPNETYFTIYAPNGRLLQPLTPFPSPLRGLVWGSIALPDPLPNDYRKAARQTPAPLWAAQGTPISEGPVGRWSVVDLPGVQAPYAQLHDLADEAFAALRERATQETGWDALAGLENAFTPLTSSLDPGFGEDWLYTGRAFAINSLMTNAGWMVAVREDLGAQTYWRLYLRAQQQDGSQGEPLHEPPWDLSARYDLDPNTYEQGGKYADVPPGYWVDITALAQQYGWQRLPALPNWRTFYRGARFNEFALTDGLDWHDAMLQLYPPEVLVTPTRLLPPTATPTRTPIPTDTPGPTRTPRPTGTPTVPPPPTSTWTPLPPTSTPPTIIP